MTTPTRYAIIGSGNIGTALARLFARAGIEVSIANTRGPESIRPLAASLGSGVHAVPLKEALESDVIFMAIPFGAIEHVRHVPAGLDRQDRRRHHQRALHAQLGRRLAGPVVLAVHRRAPPRRRHRQSLQPATGQHLAAELDPELGRRVIFIATDSPPAGDQIAELVAALGLAAVQLGRINEGGCLDPGTQRPRAAQPHRATPPTALAGRQADARRRRRRRTAPASSRSTAWISPRAAGPRGFELIVRRERPHPGAQPTFSDVHGYRFQAFATNTRVGQLAALEARHCAHARVGARIRCGKDAATAGSPSRDFAINAGWLEIALTAADLIAWT